MFAWRAVGAAFAALSRAAASAAAARPSVTFARSIRHGGGPLIRSPPGERGELRCPRGLDRVDPLKRGGMIDLRARERGQRFLGLSAPQLAAMLGLGSCCCRVIGRRRGRGGILGLEHRERRSQPREATGRRGDLSDRLKTAQRVRATGGGRLILASYRHQLRDFPPDPLAVTVASKRRVGRDLRSVERDHRQIHQPRRRAQPQPLNEQPLKRLLLINDKPRDRRVIGHQPTTDHAERRIGPAPLLDPPTEPHPNAVRVQQQRQHHLRLIRPTPRRAPRTTMQPTGIKLRDHIEHEPRQMPLLQPITHAHRQQEQLIALRAHIPTSRARRHTHSPEDLASRLLTRHHHQRPPDAGPGCCDQP